MFDSTNFVGGPYPINRRSIQRYRSYLHGKLIFESAAIRSDCIIRNLSQIGAMIEVPNGDAYPAHPLLLVTKSGALHESTTIWNTPSAFGVRFDKSFDLKDGGQGRFQEAYRLWLEHRPR
jgi:hypothetical protein